VNPGPPHETTPGIAQADPLYKGFPDFSAWAGLTPADVDLWDRFAATLSERRSAATPEALKSAVEVAVRAAALDTGAIEGLYDVDRGFTMTVALQSLAWEHAIEERGAGVRELFEAQLEAYELVLDAVTRNLPISEAWIRALHEKLCAPQKTYRVLTDLGWQEQELPKGQYKNRPNHVRLTDGTFHAYAPVDRVPEEMHRLVEQLRAPEFEAAHPVLQASYCHYAFVVIHPFADGNGRVARALASIFFYRAQSIPLVIFANQRPAYLDTLHAADLGDFRPVISFFRDRGIDTMQLVAESLMTAQAPKPGELAARISSLAEKQEGLSTESIRNIADRIIEQTSEEFDRQVSRLGLLNLTPGDSYGIILREPAPDGYQFAGPPTYEAVVFELQAGKSKSIALHVSVLFSKKVANPFPFLVRSYGSPDELEIRREDVSPELSDNFKLRLSNWIQRRLADMLQDLERQLSH
jgi:Fic family protein